MELVDPVRENRRTTKAVILARGLGTRMRADDAATALNEEQAQAAGAGLKGMIPIGRPFLDYVISALADAGIRDVCLVIGPEHDVVRDYYGSLPLSRVRVHFAVQTEPRGTADAVTAAEEFGGGDTFLVLNADNYYPVVAYQRLAALGSSGLVGFSPQALVSESNIPEERIRRFALVECDDDSGLVSIVEKPDQGTYERLAGRSLVSMNLWSFTPVIFEACRRVLPSPRGELELQDAVRIAREVLHERFTVLPLSAGVLDLSTRRDVEAVAEALSATTVTL